MQIKFQQQNQNQNQNYNWKLQPELKLESKPKSKPDSKHRKSSLKLREEFFNEVVDEEKYINEEIFRNYFKYQTPSSLVKDLFKAEGNKNEKNRYLIINKLIKLIEDINIKQIPENEYPKEVVNIVEKIFNFNEQQKDRILTPKQILQRICQIIYSLF